MSRSSFWGIVALALVATSAHPARVTAQPTARHNHWATIDRLLKEIGGAANLATATPMQRSTLYGEFNARGQFFQDMYEYERLVVRDHALHRASIARQGGPAIPATSYFLGRALQEMGLTSKAAAAYASVGASAPEGIRNLAAEWNATLSPGGAGDWKRDLQSWRGGRSVAPAPCPPASASCELFEAILADDARKIVRLQRELMQDPKPDYVEPVRSRREAYPVEFFDPLPLYLLAAADYTLAAQTLKGLKIDGVDAARGVMLLRAGSLEDAEIVLRGAVPAGGLPVTEASVAMGEVLFRKGNTDGAEKFWRSASGRTLSIVLATRTALGSDLPGALRRDVLRQYEAEKSRGWVGMKEGRAGGEFLARALLRLDQPDKAVEVLAAVRPPSYGTNLNSVFPYVLVLTSRSRYMLGRRPGQHENYPFARGDIAALAEQFPVANPLLKLMQVIIAPTNVAEMRSGR